MAKYTLVWGNIGDSPEKRLDHIECEEGNQQALMDEAFKLIHAETEYSILEDAQEQWDILRSNTPYDVFAVFDGHLTESQAFSFR